MGWLSSENKRVPDTIGKKRADELQRRGARLNWLGKKETDRRRLSADQRGKSRWN